MPPPEHLAYEVFTDVLSAITDTADVATALDTFLATCGWADEGGGVYKSPESPNGRFMKVTVDAGDGSYLTLEFEDDLGRSAPVVRLNLGGASTFHIWGSAKHLFVQNTTENEWCGGALETVQPEGDDAHDNILAVTGCRDAGGSATGAHALTWSVYDVNAAAYAGLSSQIVGILETRVVGGSAASAGKTIIGTRKELPLVMFGLDTATDYRMRGLMPNMLLMSVAAGATVGMVVPIHFTEGDTVNFRVTAVPAGAGWRLAMKEDE